MASNTIGCITEFKPENEKIEVYLKRLQLFFQANGIEEDNQVSVLLTVIGSTNYTLLNNMVSPGKPMDKSFTQLAEVLCGHFDPKPLVIAERFHFHRREQAPGKSISNYVTELRRLATHCNFGGYLDQVLRDRLVCGIHHEITQKGLLSEANLTLKKAIEVACNIKAAEAQTSQLKGTNNTPVMAVEHMKRKNGTRPETSPINVEVHSMWGRQS